VRKEKMVKAGSEGLGVVIQACDTSYFGGRDQGLRFKASPAKCGRPYLKNKLKAKGLRVRRATNRERRNHNWNF
jgi:hypothetical protein